MSTGTRSATLGTTHAAAEPGPASAAAPAPAAPGAGQLTIFNPALLDGLPDATAVRQMRREELRTLLTALGLDDESSNPRRVTAVETWRASQEALRGSAGNNLIAVHDVVQLISDASKVGTVVTTDADAGSLTVKFNGEAAIATVLLAEVKRFELATGAVDSVKFVTYDMVQLISDTAKVGTVVSIDADAGSVAVKFNGEAAPSSMPITDVQPFTAADASPAAKRQRTDEPPPIAVVGSTVEMLMDREHDIWMPVTISAYSNGVYDLISPTGCTVSGVEASALRLATVMDESGDPDVGAVVTHNGMPFTIKSVVKPGDNQPILVHVINDANPAGLWVDWSTITPTVTGPAGTPASDAAAAAAAAAAATAAAAAPPAGGTAAAGTGLTLLGSLGTNGVPGLHTQTGMGMVAPVGHPTDMAQLLNGLKSNGAAGAAGGLAVTDYTLAWKAILPGDWTTERIHKLNLHVKPPPAPQHAGTPIPESTKAPDIFTIGGLEFGKKTSGRAKPLTKLIDYMAALSRYEIWREQLGTWAPNERVAHNLYTATLLGYTTKFPFAKVMEYDELFRRHLFSGTNPSIQSWSGFDGRLWAECFLMPNTKAPSAPAPRAPKAPKSSDAGTAKRSPEHEKLSKLPHATKDGSEGCRLFNTRRGCSRHNCPHLHHCLGCGTADVSYATCPTCRPSKP